MYANQTWIFFVYDKKYGHSYSHVIIKLPQGYGYLDT